MADDSWDKELAKLSPEARRRVEQSLKAGLAAELASEALSPEARLAEFSRGWFFSRSKPSSCLLYTSPSPRDGLLSRMPSSA